MQLVRPLYSWARCAAYIDVFFEFASLHALLFSACYLIIYVAYVLISVFSFGHAASSSVVGCGLYVERIFFIKVVTLCIARVCVDMPHR